MKKKPWRSVRCVVEYRTNSDLSEADFARDVQHHLEQNGLTIHYFHSKIWVKGFNRVLALREGARPRRLRAVIRALEALTARLRRL